MSTSKERIERIMQHKEGGSGVPILDKPWRGTVMRWGKTRGCRAAWTGAITLAWIKCQTISADITPQYPKTVLEETEEYEES